MKPFDTVSGKAISLARSNIDTDLIFPGRFLKTITRVDLGKHLFEALRTTPDNPFDTPEADGASILLAGENFGIGSSREHAAWALMDFGFRVVIAPSFGDIFASNSFKNGLLLIVLGEEAVAQLAQSETIAIDLSVQAVTGDGGVKFSFAIDPFRKRCLIEGLDEIGLTEREAQDIAAFETHRAMARPWAMQSSKRKTA